MWLQSLNIGETSNQNSTQLVTRMCLKLWSQNTDLMAVIIILMKYTYVIPIFFAVGLDDCCRSPPKEVLYCILFYSILCYSILCYSILWYFPFYILFKKPFGLAISSNWELIFYWPSNSINKSFNSCFPGLSLQSVTVNCSVGLS